jgi:hypothetical protein
MCSVIILSRPEHDWPIIIAANRDEMHERPWDPPARHWSDRPEVVAGRDVLAGGSWLGINDFGLVAGILNRRNTLGPQPGKRSRGELVLEALDHADAVMAAEALSHLDGRAYRPFNMVVADNRDAFWLRADGTARVQAHPIPAGLHMLTALELDDPASPRIAAFHPRFRTAATPAPEAGDWAAWQALLADPGGGTAGEEMPAMCFLRPDGFGMVSGSLIALPAIGSEAKPHWLFAAGRPDQTAFMPVPLA